PLLGREAFGAQRLDRPIACAGIERIAPRDGVTRLAVIGEAPLQGGPLAVEVLEAVGRFRAEGTLSQGPDLGGRGAARPQTLLVLHQAEGGQGLRAGLAHGLRQPLLQASRAALTGSLFRTSATRRALARPTPSSPPPAIK